MSPRDLKLLWGRAASTCSMCRCRLDNIASDGTAAPIGEVAHIVAESIDGPRGQSILNSKERNSYLNLVLMCPTCHTTIDNDPAGYPIEKLHMLKAEHELRMQGCAVLTFDNDVAIPTTHDNDIAPMVNFVSEWKSFLPFWSSLFNSIEMSRMEDMNVPLGEEKLSAMLSEWHARRDKLKDLLFLAKESALVVQRIPDWERLRVRSEYLSEGNYLTPFSFMLDFVNPYYMVANHGKDLWPASFISQEFLDYLAFKYPEVKMIWRLNA